MEDIARSDFTYLEDSLAEVDVVLGDARLRMTDDLLPGGRRYDVLAIDAFSSDAIPIHLLTAEASELYWRLLAPDGLLVFHVSNRFVELEPVVRALAGRMQARIGRFTTERSRRRGVDRTTWLVVAKPDNPFFEDPRVSRLMEAPDDDVPPVLWTDDFASLWPVLDLR